MLLLALDTTARVGGLALARDGELIAARTIASDDGLAAVVYPAALELLSEQGLALGDVDAYAAASGPGSFTGIRVGLTAVKALAEVQQKPVLPVTILDALAYAADAPFRAPVLDGRREEVFAAVYDAELKGLIEPAARNWEAFREQAAAHQPLWIGVDEKVFSADGAAPLEAGEARLIIERPVEPLALLASERLAAGGGIKPESVEAAYIRRPDAERNWRAP